MKELRKTYWCPLHLEEHIINSENFFFPFNTAWPEGEWTSRHAHPHWAELVVLHAGSAVIETSASNYLANESQLIWIPPRTDHSFYTLKACTDRSVFIHESLFESVERFHTCHIINNTPLLKEMLSIIYDWKLDLADEKDLRIAHVIWDIIQRSESTPMGIVMPKNHKLQQLANKFLENIEDPISINDWSKTFGMSAKTLTRLFFRETGMTIGQWEQRAKMDYAYRLLRGGESVTNTALACGYNSVSSFITAFRRHFGKTPGSLLTSSQSKA